MAKLQDLVMELRTHNHKNNYLIFQIKEKILIQYKHRTNNNNNKIRVHGSQIISKINNNNRSSQKEQLKLILTQLAKNSNSINMQMLKCKMVSSKQVAGKINHNMSSKVVQH